ncbi:hypothetical protein SAMN05660649_01252 [Desulfotomaculum arcticum]|uniref:Uncharacterized protein n=1 Tax=Desulfotruncus arcticus DSM 17038 TaxID=1121424 RepID=A0A1I2QKB6_9FIRM|nr:hypothetical protein [Desulfotruncus arcticus]SFG28053.1 hypothetical protein SAMN05660649_01252 [Desulfotomaculum arcticum] [Desulfotruncus arcticus DSM 17038]
MYNNILINIYNSIHKVESRLNHLECKYPDIVKEDDVTRVYNLLAELCEETNTLGNLISAFGQLSSPTLEIINNLLNSELNSNNTDKEVTKDLMVIKKIVNELIALRKQGE